MFSDCDLSDQRDLLAWTTFFSKRTKERGPFSAMLVLAYRYCGDMISELLHLRSEADVEMLLIEHRCVGRAGDG